ncbi:MAG: hypothetical protein ABI295_03840, partial [Xanthomarina sp.]
GQPLPQPTPDPTPVACTFLGYTSTDTSNNAQTPIPAAELTTDFYYTSSNGAEVEIYETSNPGNFWFLTKVVAENGTGPGTLSIGGVNHPINVTCKRTGNAVGEEMRYEVNGATLDAEFCVTISVYH